jgi:hypothetical protein
MAANDARRQLLDFINKKAFDPVIDASIEKYEGKDREQLKDIQRKTVNEKKQFENDYTSADEVKSGFLSNVRSEHAEKVNHTLERLKLPTLPSLKDDFMKLCDKLGV